MTNIHILSRGLLLLHLIITPLSFAESKPTIKERLEAVKHRVTLLKKSNLTRIYSALILGIKYGKQAKLDEANGYALAHEKAAYDWGFEVGDPRLVKLIRFYWESVQLGVFSIGDYQENKGTKSDRWKTLESLVGGNGKEYTVNKEYIGDIFHDVSIATDGAKTAHSGNKSDFSKYAKKLTSK